MRVGAIVEGLGDRKSFPTLVAKTSQMFDKQVFVHHLIECGGWGALKRDGGLERYGRLMAASADIDTIIFAVDLDDGCPVEAVNLIEERRENLSVQLNVPVSVCLLNREYETWFLQDLLGIRQRSPEVEWVEGYEIANPLEIRDAKGAFSRAMRLTYRPSVDQDRFTKKMDLHSLLGESRSLRKLACVLSGLSHAEVQILA